MGIVANRVIVMEVRHVASNFFGGVLFEENVDLILQPIKVQEQLKSLCSVCIAHIHEGIQ